MSDLVYYDADGNQVPEGDVNAVVQYHDDDPARPDANKPAEKKAVTAPAENKAVKSSANK